MEEKLQLCDIIKEQHELEETLKSLRQTVTELEGQGKDTSGALTEGEELEKKLEALKVDEGVLLSKIVEESRESEVKVEQNQGTQGSSDGNVSNSNIGAHSKSHVPVRPVVTEQYLKSIPKPDKYQKGQNFSRFAKRFRQYVQLSRVKNNDLDILFLSFIDDDQTYEKLSRVVLLDLEKRDIMQLTQRYEREMYPNVTSETLKTELVTMTQGSTESCESFAFRISEVAERAYTDITIRNENSKAAYIRGLRDVSIKSKILEHELVDFDEAVKLANKLEKIQSVANVNVPEDAVLYNIESKSRVNNNTASRQFPNSNSENRQMYNNSYRRDYTSSNNTGNVPDRHMSNRRDRTPVQCWLCQGFGHTRKFCPNNGQNRRRGNQNFR